MIGKQEVTETVMKAFLAGGHVLVEDIPGLGKTTMAIAFSRKREMRLYIIREPWSATCFWQMRLTGRLRRHSQPFWK